MFELFPDQPVYEFPNLVNVIYAMVWAFALSSIIAITHKVTFKGKRYPPNFFQAMILGSIVTTMVMMAIGDSLARGLGVFGAMAIIRFRTRIEDPRNVLFLFAALSVGLAIGVYGYTVAFAGTLIFSLAAFLLHFSPFTLNNKSRGSVNFAIRDLEMLNQVLDVCKQYCEELTNTSMSVSRAGEEKIKVYKYQYMFILKKNASAGELLEALNNIEPLTQLRISMDDDLN